VREERPDGSNNLSFPSGHTTTAFTTAHFMFREYQDENIWLSLSGYPIAVFTGVYRILNDKHWVGDVVAGAGIGILSTEVAYWLFPKVSQLFSKDHSKIVLLYIRFIKIKQWD
jgi:membrane-associated phospholipid phosphatase